MKLKIAVALLMRAAETRKGKDLCLIAVAHDAAEPHKYKRGTFRLLFRLD
jgi:hypothetical protein